jgi:hypothetical protein
METVDRKRHGTGNYTADTIHCSSNYSLQTNLLLQITKKPSNRHIGSEIRRSNQLKVTVDGTF